MLQIFYIELIFLSSKFECKIFPSFSQNSFRIFSSLLFLNCKIMSWFDISWPELGKEKVSLKTRPLIETEVQKIHEKTEIKVSELVAFAGVSKSTWHERKSRKGIETRHNHETPKLNWYTLEERTAVVKYVLTHKNFLYGYRYLAWQMIDENVAFVRPASVYNIMKEYDLVQKQRQIRKISFNAEN